MRPGTLLRWHALKSILKSEIRDNSVVLDIGSFDGYISYNLKKFFPELKIIVVDVDQAGLKQAKDRGMNALCASALELPIKDNKIDFVLCLDVIEHVEEDEKMIKEVSRVLKPGGKIILATPMQDGVSFPFLGRQRIEDINKIWGHIRKGYSLENIKELFLHSNLRVINTNKYFNVLSRFVYQFVFLSEIPLKGKGLLYKSIIKLEPYVKWGAEEHIIVAQKGRL